MPRNPAYLARTGRDGDRCDLCRAPIPPWTLCYTTLTAERGALLCQRCGTLAFLPEPDPYDATVVAELNAAAPPVDVEP